MYKYIFSLFLLVGVVAISYFWWRPPEPVSAPSTSLTVIHEEGTRSEYRSDGIYFVDQNDAAEKASATIQNRFRRAEWLTSFVMPSLSTLGTNETIALSSYDVSFEPAEADSGCASVNRLYRYELSTDALDEMYSETSTDGSPMLPTNCRILRIAGTVDRKIIVLIDDPHNSPGPCTNIWHDYRNQFVIFDPNQPSAGLQKFIVPDEKIAEGKEDQDECLANLEQNW